MRDVVTGFLGRICRMTCSRTKIRQRILTMMHTHTHTGSRDEHEKLKGRADEAEDELTSSFPVVLVLVGCDMNIESEFTPINYTGS